MGRQLRVSLACMTLVAPRSNSSCTAAGRPQVHAMCSGVWRYLFTADNE